MQRPFLVSSDTVKKYLKLHGTEWANPNIIKEFRKQLKGKEKPYHIGFYFIRDSKRRFDYINAAQLPCDLMTKYKWIEDDNADEIIPHFLGYETDKKKAGIIIKVLEQPLVKEFNKEKELEELADILFFFAQLVNRNQKSSIRVLEEEFNTEEKGYVNVFGLVEDVVFGAEYSFIRRYRMSANKYGYTKEDILSMYWKKWQKNMYERLGKEWA